MGGPSVSIFLAVDPIEDDRLKLWNTLDVLGVRALGGQEWPDIWFETTRPIGGCYDGEGRPFGVKWDTGEFDSGEDEDTPTKRRDSRTGLESSRVHGSSSMRAAPIGPTI